MSNILENSCESFVREFSFNIQIKTDILAISLGSSFFIIHKYRIIDTYLYPRSIIKKQTDFIYYTKQFMHENP